MMTSMTRALAATTPRSFRAISHLPHTTPLPAFLHAPAPPHRRSILTRFKETPEERPTSDTAAKHTAAEQETEQPQSNVPQTQARSTPPARTAPSDFDMSLSPFYGPPSLQRLSTYMSDMQREVDDMIRTFLGPLASSPLMAPPTDLMRPLSSMLGPLSEAGGMALSPLHVEETDGSFIVAADVPGMSGEDVKVCLTPEHELVIRGEKKQVSEEEGGFKQRRYRNFVRRVRLPEWVEAEGIQAKTKDGVLTISIPKSEGHLKQQVKEIPVSAD